MRERVKGDWKGFFRDLWSSGNVESTQMSDIMTSNAVSDEVKKVLVKTLEEQEKKADKFRNQYKTKLRKDVDDKQVEQNVSSFMNKNSIKTAKDVVSEQEKEEKQNTKNSKSRGYSR